MSTVSREHQTGSLHVPRSPRGNTGRAQSRSQAPPPRPSKRLVLCEDGTWLNSDNGNLKESINIPSNVTRISRAIKSQSSDGIPQVKYYHFGVGAGGGPVDKLMGISGNGLSEIVREGYQFLATNWVRNDEIFIFGFSRGAYTARAIAGLVGQIGLLTKDGLPFLSEIWRDVQHQHDQDYRPRNPNIPFPNKPSANDPSYRRELAHLGLTRLDVPIKALGVWDTVGALGFPKIGWLTRLGLQSRTQKELSFYDTSLDDCIEYAFQALALDERRFAFQPALWEKLQGNHTVLRQVWFPGAHANIGGSYDDQQIATISLAWMMAQVQPLLDVDTDYLFQQWDLVEEYYQHKEKSLRPWSFGKIFDGIAGVYAAGGAATRTPGRYCVVHPETGRQTRTPLKDTFEYVHPCVRTRLKLGGPGLDDRGHYECHAMRDWRLVIEEAEPGAKRPDIYWKARARPTEGFARFLPEAPLKPLEVELMYHDRETKDYVLKPAGVRQRHQRRSTRRRSRPVSH